MKTREATRNTRMTISICLKQEKPTVVLKRYFSACFLNTLALPASDWLNTSPGNQPTVSGAGILSKQAVLWLLITRSSFFIPE